MVDSMNDLDLIIDGTAVSGAGSLNVINPATGEVFATCGRADGAQLDQAVAAAVKAFPDWAKAGIEHRRERLMAVADAIEQRIDEFSRLLTSEQGKPLEAAATEIMMTVGTIRGFASFDLEPRTLRESDTVRVVEHRTPLGVVAAITPWNFPLFILSTKFAPALLAGNTMVAKPSPTTPLTTLLLGSICRDLLPPGVFNVIVDDNDLGTQLTAHPGVAKVAFTGSSGTGRKIMASAAGTLKRITLELGGNDPAIVLPDVDPVAAAPHLFAAAMANSGQVCVAIKRLYVHSSTYDRFCEELAKLATATVVDDGAKQGSQLGPVHSKAQYDKVSAFIEQAKQDGTVIAGGDLSDKPGYFISPTIVRDIDDGAQLVREEQFGPVLPVLRYDDINDAIRRANDSDFALGASVWSNDLQQAQAVAMQIASGTVWINNHLDLQLDLPLRGARQSGIGAELGQAGFDEYTQPHIINMTIRELQPA